MSMSKKIITQEKNFDKKTNSKTSYVGTKRHGKCMEEILLQNPELSDILDKSRENIKIFKGCLRIEEKKYDGALMKVFDIMRNDGVNTSSEEENVVKAM